MKINIVEINDLHFGIKDTVREREELNLFLNFISNKDNPIDLIIFGGDYFDHKLTFYYDYNLTTKDYFSLIGLEFFNKVVSIAKERNIKIRMIEGTFSHDNFQPRFFKYCIPEENGKTLIDYNFYETVSEENVCGLNILYIPEEYPLNHEEYYAPFKEKQYDLIVSHGTWDFINFGGMIENDRNDIHTAPVLKYDEWSKALEHGICVSGHIHGRYVFKNKNGVKIIYPGAFTAWSFDQISKRGFVYLTFDTDTKDISYKFIDNEQSPKYANLDIKDIGLDLEKCSVDDIKEKIQEQKEKVNFLKINLDALPLEKKDIFKNYYKNDSFIKTEVTPEKILLTESTDSNKFDKYNYIIKGEMPKEKVIQKFIKDEYNEDINEEYIKNAIKEDK